jgi:peroxiredoxin
MSRKAPNRKTALYITLIAIGIFLVGGALIPYLSQAQMDALEAGGYARMPVRTDYPAPVLALDNLDGDPVSLADYHGQVVLVNNWATWCPPCKAEMPELNSYYEAHRDEGFVIVAIESGEPASQVAEFATSYGLSFPIWIDPLGAALETFGNFNLPSSYVIDRDGTVRMFWTGPVDVITLEKYVTPLLER